MHPYESDQIARLRVGEFAREAAARRHPPHDRSAARPNPERRSSSRAVSRRRHAVGLALINVGLRFVDPNAVSKP